MLLAPPPTLPKISTDETARKFYTLHHRTNTAFCIPHRTQKMAVLSFGRLNDVHIMGHMIENHVKRLGEWPEVGEDESMNIFSGGNDLKIEEELDMLSVIEWDMEEIKFLCASSYLDLLHVEKLIKTRDGYGISGNRYMFEGNQLFYTTILNQLYEKE